MKKLKLTRTDIFQSEEKAAMLRAMFVFRNIMQFVKEETQGSSNPARVIIQGKYNNDKAELLITDVLYFLTSEENDKYGLIIIDQDTAQFVFNDKLDIPKELVEIAACVMAELISNFLGLNDTSRSKHDCGCSHHNKDEKD